MFSILQILVLSLVILSFFLLMISFRLKKVNQVVKQQYMIPEGSIIYDDLISPSESLYSPQFFLSGKPDYILKKKEGCIPVEVKTGNHVQPQNHHVMQLMAYCQIVQDFYQQMVPYGILIYIDTEKKFTIPFTNDRKKQLHHTIHLMKDSCQRMTDKNLWEYIDESRCSHCSMKNYCQYSRMA